MNTRLATVNDLNSIMPIIHDAQVFMKSLNMDQWQNNYPDESDFIIDINKNQCYVSETEGKIAGVMIVSFENEESYEKVRGKGFSVQTKNYAVIHRMAVKKDLKGIGVSSEMLKAAEKICRDNNCYVLRVDTHRLNIVMQKFLLKNGFEYCGEVDIVSEGETLRYVYEKRL